MMNGSSSASNAGGNSLAIAERPKPAPSCVAALFQLFAKRKLFSSSSKKSKLLPPVLAQKKSAARPLGGGGEKMSVGKRPLLLDSVHYPGEKNDGGVSSRLPPSAQDNNGSEMCYPGVVARLMGLSSMPAVPVSYQRPTKVKDSSDLRSHRNVYSQDLPGTHRSIETSPQKQQKAGQLREGRHANANQFSTDARPSWSRRHTHKLASPVKSPRSISSRNKARLIEAATKVLEPGLQSRNRHLSLPHARLEYSCISGSPSSSAAVLLNLSEQLSRDLCNLDVLRSGAHNVGATSLQNPTSSNQWSEENGKKDAPLRRPNQAMSCQVQPEGNSKDLLVSSSEKARPTSLVYKHKDSIQRTSSGITDRKQDNQKIQQRIICRENVAGSPLKQNNLKQNSLPVVCLGADPGCMVEKQKHRIGEQNSTSTSKVFIPLNTNLNSNTSFRSKRKVMDRFGTSQITVDKNSSTKGPRANIQRRDSFNCVKLKTATPKAIERGMIIAKGAGLVSEKPKAASSSHLRSDFQRQVERYDVSRGNSPGIISFSLSSPRKVVPTLLGDNDIRMGGAVVGSPTPSGASCPKTCSCRDCQNISSQRGLVFRESLHSNSGVKVAESVSFNQDTLKNRYDPGGRASSSVFENTSAIPFKERSSGDELTQECIFMKQLIHGFRDLSKSVELHGTHEKLEINAKASHSTPSVNRGSDQQSALSILHASFADDCILGGIHKTASNDKSFCAFFTNIELKDNCSCGISTPPPTSVEIVSTKINSRRAEPNFSQHGIPPFELAIQEGKLRYPGEVTATIELLLTSMCPYGPHKAKAPFKAFLHETFQSALTTLTTGARNNFNAMKAKDASLLRNLVFNFVMECLESMCNQFLDSGYKSLSGLALICTEERLVGKVKKEIVRCSDMAGKTLDDLVASDFEHSDQMGMNTLQEAFRIGAQIEAELLQELVKEIGLDLLKPS